MIGEPSTELAVSLLNADGSVGGRLGADEEAVADIPKGLGFSTSDPGGFKDATMSLARAIAESYPDTEILRPIRIYGEGERTAWEGRLHETPHHAAADEDEVPGAVGHVARLDDDPSFAEIYLDSDLSGWGPPSLQRISELQAPGAWHVQPDPQATYQDTSGNLPGIAWIFTNLPNGISGNEAWYYGGGVDIGRLLYNFRGLVEAETWQTQALLANFSDTNFAAGTFDISANYKNNPLQTQKELAATAAGRKYASLIVAFTNAGAANPAYNAKTMFEIPKVMGRHGLTLAGAWPNVGVLGSDVIADIVGRAASDLQFTTGAGGTIQPSTFAIPHLVFKEGVKGSDAILATNAFHYRSWGVYEDKTFFWRPATEYRKRWRIRRSKAHGVDLLGPQAEDAYNGVVCTFTDPSGVTRVIGPTGCPTAYATSPALEDTSATNPVNLAGIPRKWAELKLGFVTTVIGAIQVAAAWLADKLLSARSRGSVVVTGLVEDDATGALYPAWCMRAGDSAIVTDGDNIERGIIETTYDHDSRTCSASMDATPHKIDALMERMGVVLVGVTG
jgi:hypothetical protein